MLAVILKILSIIGIVLLVLLCIAVLLLLIVLFMPVVYRIDGCFNESEKMIKARFRWLLGLLRGGYVYPEPGRFIVKLLWITLYDSGKTKAVSGNNSDAESATEENSAEKQENKSQNIEPQSSEGKSEQETVLESSVENAEMQEDAPKQTLQEKLLAKYEKIKYTIQKFCDKIKHILENIQFYLDLLQEESSQELMYHIFGRVGKVLKHIRPRKLKADILFGTGSPDTTGYLYGIYGMISSSLGKNVFVTPDFSQQIFRGTLLAKGHISLSTLLVNVLTIVLDKRLHSLIRNVKSHNTANKKSQTVA